MEYDNKFGNIELYLWQIRKSVADVIRERADLIGNVHYFDESEFFFMACRLMLKYMLKRFSMPGKNPIVDIDSIVNELYDRGITFEASNSWYAGRIVSNILLSGIEISINPSGKYPLRLSTSRQHHHFNWKYASVSGSDLVDIIFLMKELAPRLQAIVHEEYQGRISKTAANRIRRIAAKARRRMQ